MSQEFKTIIYGNIGRVTRLTLNRPEKLNAIDDTMMAELKTAFDICQADDETRVLVITGMGRGFCSGEEVDRIIKVFTKPAPSSEVPLPTPLPAGALTRHLVDRVEKPVIAAVNGVCCGAGYGLALASDIRIAAETARFVHVYFRRALIPSCNTWFLPRIIGLGPAIYHIFNADEIDAAEALRLNLVSKVVPEAELPDAAMEIAERIAKVPPTTVKFTKRAIYKSLGQSFTESMEYIAYARLLAATTGETTDSLQAFKDKS